MTSLIFSCDLFIKCRLTVYYQHCLRNLRKLNKKRYVKSTKNSKIRIAT